MRARQRAVLPCTVFGVCALVYVLTLGNRILTTSPDNHYLHLANSWLHGELAVLGDRPPGSNDWALYQGRWYVSFPPLPALIVLPAVALAGGTALPDCLFWALIAALGPALLFVLLRSLRERGRSERSERDDLVLTGLFAFGSVYYFVAVQGSVWFAAHVVACPLLILYLLHALGARQPLLAGVFLGLAFLTRPPTLLAALFFLLEALAQARPADTPPVGSGSHVLVRARRWLGAVCWRASVRPLALFTLPLLAVGLFSAGLNLARFDDPFEFGHTYLQVAWRGRIDTWGLFNYHYFARNLAVFATALPWLSIHAPYLTIGRHGLALWFTTPQLLWLLWPARVPSTSVALYLSAAAIAIMDLCYQNSGWIQFGYRFATDYLPLLFGLLALSGRRFGPGFHALMVFALIVNLFGAVTFDRMPEFYDTDLTQRVIFQPD
ncbi:MAG: hypothetical protein MJD61_16760 [Proteobacteria bacterium]|nr:hypothetical protein [Pseudomonadota bacterium]